MRGQGSAAARLAPQPCPHCESRQSSCLSPKARELLLVLGQWMQGTAAEFPAYPPGPAAQLLCRPGEALTPNPTHFSRVNSGAITDPFPHSCLSVTHTGCHLLWSPPRTPTPAVTCPINTGLPRMLSVLHTQSSWPQQGLLTHTPRCHVPPFPPSPSNSHTHCLCHLPSSHTGVAASKNPYT